MGKNLWTNAVVLALFIVGLSTLTAFAAGMVDNIHDFDIGCKSCHVDGAASEDIGLKSCLSCHGSYPELAKKTQGVEYNPHDAHVGELECNLCHLPHEESVFYCSNCHADWEQEMPENVTE